MTRPNLHASPHPLHAKSGKTDEPSSEQVETLAVVFTGPRTPDEYDLAQMFTEWAWFTGLDWDDAVRVLARALRGAEGAGLIVRRRIRRRGTEPLHCLELTDLGQEAIKALSGRWIREEVE